MDIGEIILNTRFFVLQLWWLWIFCALLWAALMMWKAYAQEWYKQNEFEWEMFEIKIPREVRRSPRAMEQVFLAIHGQRNIAGNISEAWWDGEVPKWCSCEMVSIGGEIRFFMRLPAKFRNPVEAALYAHYPDIELIPVPEVQDYIRMLPPTSDELRAAGYDFFGTELLLARPDPYPIKTYVDFEDNEEDRQLDPIGHLLEVLAKLRSGEHAWIQILVRPIDDVWKEKSGKVLRELKEKSARTQVETPTGALVWIERSPGELEVIKAIERNIAKPGFQTIIRYLYIGSKDAYQGATFGRRAISSSFNQYASESLNKFRHNFLAWTRTGLWYPPHLFPKAREMVRRRKIYRHYRIRHMPDMTPFLRLKEYRLVDWGQAAQQTMILNTEELATLFHPPTFAVLTGPLIKRVESRKVGPPAGLPIYGEEEKQLPLQE